MTTPEELVPVPPEACETMLEVRAGVDALDEQIATLLAWRFRFMEAAARIKPTRAAVRDDARKAAVVAHARQVAQEEGADPEVVAHVYDALVEASIAFEFGCWDARAASPLQAG